ncbi:hypothetical protein DH2020_033801 [Rehmannia glutinosa]|uniref:TCP domain-containing protein n=1 Tax=Rehmannia glutinosa TaxID=99300 RepID=A0ABR0VBN9_REHGL
MGDSSYQNPSSSRLGSKNTVGEIVEVQGGHIVRSTGRKDRHSKVCTAKGPRDRRVRLAAHTAIQFYDVQDRLGYDRPSKAVDWLIKKAKSAIDELAELPAWHPTISSAPNATSFEPEDDRKKHDLAVPNVSSSKRTMGILGDEGEQQQQQQQISSFLPPSLDSDVIADTIKSFFPMGASGEASSSAMQFQNSNNNNNNSQDLRLSLQSFQDPIYHQNPSHHAEQSHTQARIHGQILLSGTPLGFDGWPPENHQPAAELSRFHGGATAGYLFNSPPAQHQFGGHNNQFFSQRGPLQSSNTPSLRAWMDPSNLAISMADHSQPGSLPIYPSSVSFASGYDGFSGFHIPARIQGDEEEHDGYSDKPSSASSDSRH